MSAGNWVLYRTGLWHLWVSGSRRSACSQVSATDLREFPVRRVQPCPPGEGDGDACRLCLRAAYPAGIPSALLPPEERTTDEPTAAWANKVRMLAESRYTRISKARVSRLAALFAPCGPPGGSPTAKDAAPVLDLLLTPAVFQSGGKRIRTFARLDEALEVVDDGDTPAVDVLPKIGRALEAWRQITGRDFSQDRAKVDVVLKVALNLPDPADPYIRRLHGRDFSHLAGVFHPNTYARARRDPALRGLFWDGETGTGGGADLLDGVEIVQ